jgi:AhpD family alkylhydroperoxidase
MREGKHAMPRLDIPTVEELPEGSKDIFDKLMAARGRISTFFATLAWTPKVLEKREAYGRSLRTETILDPRLRELAICRVAVLNGGGYEFKAHARMALAAGVPQEKIDAVADYETAPVFGKEERAVLRYADEVTKVIRVSDGTWAACAAFLNKRELVELVLTVAWYNQTARVTWPLMLLED